MPLFSLIAESILNYLKPFSFRLFEFTSLIAGVLCFCAFIFFWFPSVYLMAANADSLVLFDFARDLITQTPISYWNLPRAPYLFPDTVIAALVIAPGWYGNASLLTVAVANFLILTFVSQFIFRNSIGIPSPSPRALAFTMAIGIVLIGSIFSEAMSNLYWQLFASGAHLLTAIIVALIFFLSQPRAGQQLPFKTLVLVSFLTFAEAISDSMSLLLIAAWWVMQLFIRRHYLTKSYADLILIPLMLILGTSLSFLLPRQELVGSFFSINLFINHISYFLSWLNSSPINYIFLSFLLTSTLAWPFLLRGHWPQQITDINVLVKDHFFLPSMAIFFATPLFYHEIGSMRYYSFPALVSILSLCLLFLRIFHWVRSRELHLQFGLAVASGFIVIGVLLLPLLKKQPSDSKELLTTVDKIGLTSAVENVPKALQCIEKASKQLPLQDGVASYWSARPIHFASHFQIYLAQINPWRPRSGYFLWGNNGLDFIYKRDGIPSLRNYNFIIATNHEIESGLWNVITTKASEKIVCEQNTLFYFANQDTLQTYLFPMGLPFNLKIPNFPNVLANNEIFANIEFPANQLFTQVGKRDNTNIVTAGSSGFLVFGPYIPLQIGNYQLTITGQLSGPGETLGIVDVIANNGKNTYLKIPIPIKQSESGNIVSTHFSIDKAVKDAEFRVLIFNNVSGFVSGYQLKRLDTQ